MCLPKLLSSYGKLHSTLPLDSAIENIHIPIVSKCSCCLDPSRNIWSIFFIRVAMLLLFGNTLSVYSICQTLGSLTSK